MTISWRPLAVAAALLATAAAGTAAAQTVMIKNAPAGATIEVVWNSTKAGSAVADPSGTATIPFTFPEAPDKRETDAYLFVDICEDNVRRVLIAERGQQPPDQGTGCRREGLGLFLVRRVSSFLVDVGAGTPTVMLRQGPISLTPQPVFSAPPTGFMIFGGGGFNMFRDTVNIACGTAPDCSGKGTRPTLAAGAEYWATPFLGAELGYLRGSDVTVEGGGDSYRFDTFLDTHIVTVAAKVGIPLRRFRPYGKVGTAWHRAYSGTTQTHEDIVVTVDDVEQTIEGGTQSFELETEGWRWVFGGGAEIWFNQRFAFYGELGRAQLKGDDRKGSEAVFDERATYYVFGARIRIGG